MTDQQLYIAIGIPSIVALVGILVNVGYFVSLNARFASMESRLGSVETRLDARITTLENRFDSRMNSFEAKFETLVGKVMDMDNRLIRVEAMLKH